jgi:serine/threonine protein kinase
MPPERLDGVEADTRSDIFAFGAVVYEMVSGRRAFPGDSAVSTIAALMTADPLPLNLQHPKAQDLEWIIRRCLAKSPDSGGRRSPTCTRC